MKGYVLFCSFFMLAIATGCGQGGVDCEDIDGDGYFGSNQGSCHLTPLDCDDENGAIHPEAYEVCDGVDNDCDGAIDNALEDVPEDCNSLDDDCDGLVDEGVEDLVTVYPDIDGDGYGHAAEGVEQCGVGIGYTTYIGDCDDGDSRAYIGAEEVCDDVDNDCDSYIDEGVPAENWYSDFDGDGHGDVAEQPEVSCVVIFGKVTDNSDCDDSNAYVYFGAEEFCDELDNDCDDLVDEDITVALWYPDQDGDSFGDALSAPEESCAVLGQHVLNRSDCDDIDPLINPAASDDCDDIDNDCDGYIDEGVCEDIDSGLDTAGG